MRTPGFVSFHKPLPGLLAIASLCWATNFAWAANTSATQTDVRFERGRPAHVVAPLANDAQKAIAGSLTHYLGAVLGSQPVVVDDVSKVPAGSPVILIGTPLPGQSAVPTGSDEAFSMMGGMLDGRPVLALVGGSDRGLRRAMQRAVIGSQQAEDALIFPAAAIAESPWIPEREWAICPWVPKSIRGYIANSASDDRPNIWLYSDAELARYASMTDWFGFSGIQLLETSYSYGALGSIEAAQDVQRKIARAARANGQNVSLWVWAAEFSAHGWIDPDVVTTPAKGVRAFEDPAVRRTFERYYDHYADLAPDVDRVIAHFYDPGRLRDTADVFSYLKLLETKVRARNPNIKMGVDAWGIGDNFTHSLIEHGFGDYLILATSMPHTNPPETRQAFHAAANKSGHSVGIWGWYTTEYETDQRPAMHVNAKVLKQVYNDIRHGAAKTRPISYWSEMDAYHLCNIFSMYAAGQLLWNPDRDPDAILTELTTGIWGPKNGPAVLRAVHLIQDVRSGDSWDTYWWTLPTFRLGTDDPTSDAARAAAAIKELTQLADDARHVSKFPLPVSRDTFVDLMLPHLRQIQAFAQFRVGLQALRAERDSLSKEQLVERMTLLWVPVPEYRTWVGAFGQPEETMQEKLIREACAEFGIEVREPAWVIARDADRLINLLREKQSYSRTELPIRPPSASEFRWPQEKRLLRFELLVREGSLIQTGPQTYRLPNWQSYAMP